MQRTAVAWVIYSITHSAFMLGFAVMAQQLPSFFLSLYGGIISDRYSRYKILLVTQSASMVQAILLAILILTKHYVVWEILSLSAVLGIINAFDVPARQPMIHSMVNDPEDLPNALSLNSAMVNIARLIGPALSGIVLQQFGASICFVANAVSFMAVLTSLLLMKFPPFVPPAVKKDALSDIVDGFDYVFNAPNIGMIILMVALLSFLVFPYDTLMPIFAKVIFKGNASTYGYISSFFGAGAICGTIFLASLKKGANLKIVSLTATIIMGAGLVFFSHTNYFPAAMVFAVVSGFGVMTQNTVGITIVQVKASPHMRGRMMALLALGYFGMLPLGSVIVGAASQLIGAQNTVLCQGIIALIIAALFANFLRKEELTEKEIERMGEVEGEVAEKI